MLTPEMADLYNAGRINYTPREFQSPKPLPLSVFSDREIIIAIFSYHCLHEEEALLKPLVSSSTIISFITLINEFLISESIPRSDC